ncbi:hypothetical protein [Streptomyces sp. A30]|uniref:hypothetical protein n=1 Tax=Streptomyces sp. A30 TaxID=2789273 RepID=UPI0039815E5F
MSTTDPFLQRGDGLTLNSTPFKIPQFQELLKIPGIREADQSAESHQDNSHGRNAAHRTPHMTNLRFKNCSTSESCSTQG